jgi:hypothetical protein
VFCIAAFIVLAIISIFSASHRKLAKKAWSCTMRRVTFRPCDTSFKEEAKSRLLAHVANKTPRLVKAADIAIEIMAFILVVLTVWSLFVAVKSGLNLYVWGTCNPAKASSCSLGAESCSIDTSNPSFWTTIKDGHPWVWFVNEAESFGHTVVNIPTRLQKWDASNYLPQNASYYFAKDESKPTALEIIDPGCTVCAHLFENIKQAGFENNYNLTYIAYPIADSKSASHYKFANSYQVTQYLEAVKIHPLAGLQTPADWQILERIYTWKDEENIDYQIKINGLLNNEQTKELLKAWLKNIGYDEQQIAVIDEESIGDEVKNIIEQNHQIVEKQIKTLKIPSIIFNGRRHDGLVDVGDLR